MKENHKEQARKRERDSWPASTRSWNAKSVRFFCSFPPPLISPALGRFFLAPSFSHFVPNKNKDDEAIVILDEIAN